MKISEYGNSISPGVFEIESGKTVAGDYERKRFVEPSVLATSVKKQSQSFVITFSDVFFVEYQNESCRIDRLEDSFVTEFHQVATIFCPFVAIGGRERADWTAIWLSRVIENLLDARCDFSGWSDFPFAVQYIERIKMTSSHCHDVTTIFILDYSVLSYFRNSRRAKEMRVLRHVQRKRLK